MSQLMPSGHKALHQLSRTHRQWVLASAACGCFYCCKFFEPRQITRWVDMGQTALCPHCSVDAVLPEKGMNRPLSQEILDGMNRAYFLVDVSSATAKKLLLGQASPDPAGDVEDRPSPIERWDRVEALQAKLSVDQLSSDEQLKKQLLSKFPWMATSLLALGWGVLLALPFFPPPLPISSAALSVWVLVAMVASSALSWVSWRFGAELSSWWKAWDALTRGMLARRELGLWLVGTPGLDFTPRYPGDFCYKEAEDWVRALPDLSWTWHEWKSSGKPLRKCDLSRLIEAARAHAGPQGPYGKGDPL